MLVSPLAYAFGQLETEKVASRRVLRPRQGEVEDAGLSSTSPWGLTKMGLAGTKWEQGEVEHEPAS